jgi:ketosteroid isomerase-like protein
MKRAWILFLFFGATAGWLPAQDADAATKSKISALEQLWNQAYKSGDAKALNTILDDGIVLVNDDGSVQTKAEFLASVKPPAAETSAQQQQVTPESLKVHVYANVAIATGVMVVKGVEAGKRYSRRERFVDTWLRKGDNWVCVGTDATPVLH